jgi:hypothetical protein
MSFHVPEAARDTTHPQLGSTSAAGNNGAFFLQSPEPGWRLAVIASDSSDPGIPDEWRGWEHVSVHAFRDAARNLVRMRTPTWKEMAFVKDLFWDGDDVVMQLHPRKSEYVNNHPHTLHLWRSTRTPIPTPPSILVGVLDQAKA